ncbi:MAG: T9SS type A sorting domain-containing protein [Bacteroidetes bacterium]|nr:T9SS type A sorting domain-containing protein [Bacteroidota bacterium]
MKTTLMYLSMLVLVIQVKAQSIVHSRTVSSAQISAVKESPSVRKSAGKKCIAANNVSHKETLNSRIVVTPNPSSDFFKLKMKIYEKGSAIIQLFNCEGRLIQSKTILLTGEVIAETLLDARELEQGVYILRTTCIQDVSHSQVINTNKIIKL